MSLSLTLTSPCSRTTLMHHCHGNSSSNPHLWPIKTAIDLFLGATEQQQVYFRIAAIGMHMILRMYMFCLRVR